MTFTDAFVISVFPEFLPIAKFYITETPHIVVLQCCKIKVLVFQKIVINRAGSTVAVTDIRHLFIRHRLKMSQFPLFLRNDLVGMVNTDLRTCINSILPFPQFDQPRFPLIIKVNRSGIEDHMHACRRLVIECFVPLFSLPRIHAALKNILLPL